MKPVIEFAGCIGYGRHHLLDFELREIGDFTRENIQRWMDSHQGVDWVDILPVRDFHAVCGDIDIPWATEEEKQYWNKHKDGIIETDEKARKEHELEYQLSDAYKEAAYLKRELQKNEQEIAYLKREYLKKRELQKNEQEQQGKK